ncbi:MAG: hypothetical protein ACOCXG_03100 [Nanoarchaeota archaeon]
MYNRMLFRNFGFLCVFLIFVSFASAACFDIPYKVEVRSGNFDTTEYLYTDTIYVAGELRNYPLYIDFFFNNSQIDCFSQEDFKFKLISGSVTETATLTRNTQDTYEIVEASFALTNYAYSNMTQPFESIFEVLDESYTLEMVPVHTGPEIESSNFDFFVKGNEQVNLDFGIIDEVAGVRDYEITTSGGIIKSGNFEDEGFPSQKSVSENLSSSTDKTYHITATNRVGFETVQIVKVLVDTEGPQVKNLEVIGYDVSGGSRTLDLKFDIEDKSFLENYTTLTGSIDLSSINPSLNNLNVQHYCDWVSKENKNYYSCQIKDVAIISVDETKVVDAKFILEDLNGNVNSQTIPVEIWIDNNEPEITRFEAISSKAKRSNIFNFNSSLKVYLEYTEDRLVNASSIYSNNHVPVFGQIQYPSNMEVPRLVSGKANIVWNLDSTKLAVYEGYDKKTDTFQISISDMFGNRGVKNLNVTIDNIKPEIERIELRETGQGDAADNILQSGESFSIDIFFTEENFDTKDPRVYANFSSLVVPLSNELVQARSCSKVSEDSDEYRCSFTGLKANNGYLNRTAAFYVIDDAGNTDVFGEDFEILQVGDEQPMTMQVVDRNAIAPEGKSGDGLLYIVNPLNRQSLFEGDLDAWFKGEVLVFDDFAESNYSIVKFSLQKCDIDNLTPLMVRGDGILYPDETIFDGGDFALKFEVLGHEVVADMFNRTIECNMSVTKRDLTTIYPPEVVSFDITFDFYEMPYDRYNLLKAQAQDILDMYKFTEDLDDWFDDIYDFYNKMNTFCTAWGTARGVLSAVDGVVTGVQIILSNFKPTLGVARSLGVVHKVTNFFGEAQDDTFGVGSFVNKVCNFVTCAPEGRVSWAFTEWVDGFYEAQGEELCGVEDKK